MQLSYWELKNWFSNIDFVIVGSGIVGLHTALRLRERYPSGKILVLEKGILPQGASTKNAGFACFGSLSEIIDDLKSHPKDEVISLIARRRQGLQLLRHRLGDAAIDFKAYGGYELFLSNQQDVLDECLENMQKVNDSLRPLFGNDVFSVIDNVFGFAQTANTLIYNPLEAQIDTGNMMQALLKQALHQDIMILNSTRVEGFAETGSGVAVDLGSFSFTARKMMIATNGFAAQLIPELGVSPARAQVLITKPIPGLKIKGTFHLDKGYYYFRNVGDRILFGGGRNLDFQGETTAEFGQTIKIQDNLDWLLKSVLLPGQDVEVDHRWSGIMGMGSQKTPIVRQLSENIYCGVRLGGMGVAIGSLVGKEMADLV